MKANNILETIGNTPHVRINHLFGNTHEVWMKLERANPGAISARKDSAGRLYNVGEFAAEIAAAAVEPIPENHTRLVGDVSDFGTA